MTLAVRRRRSCPTAPRSTILSAQTDTTGRVSGTNRGGGRYANQRRGGHGPSICCEAPRTGIRRGTVMSSVSGVREAGVMGVREVCRLGARSRSRGRIGNHRGIMSGAQERELSRKAVHLGATYVKLADSAADGEGKACEKRTTASCSFSSSRCRSAAVMGRGCRMGPGPEISPEASFDGIPAMLPEGWNCGEGREDEGPAWLTMLWFEGRIFSDGELGTGGGGICCDDARRARTWGDAGTVLRSGMLVILSVMSSR